MSLIFKQEFLYWLKAADWSFLLKINKKIKQYMSDQMNKHTDVMGVERNMPLGLLPYLMKQHDTQYSSEKESSSSSRTSEAYAEDVFSTSL